MIRHFACILLFLPAFAFSQTYLVKIDYTNHPDFARENKTTTKSSYEKYALSEKARCYNIMAAYAKEDTETVYDRMFPFSPSFFFLRTTTPAPFEYKWHDTREPVGESAKFLVRKANGGGGEVIFLIEYAEKTVGSIMITDGVIYPEFQTRKFNSALVLKLDEPTLLYTYRETRKVRDADPLWGGLPFIGSYFTKDGMVEVKETAAVTVTKIAD